MTQFQNFPIFHWKKHDSNEPWQKSLQSIFSITQNAIRSPETLWIQGQTDALELLDALPQSGLAIVGTRRVDLRALRFILDALKAAQRFKPIIVSGLAEGIDTEAHKTALKLQLPTVAFPGGGVRFPYPRSGTKLRQQILEQGGLILSELSPDEAPYKSTFLDRNRLIAAFARCVWVVQAPYPSGALNTAAWARKLDRILLATSCSPEDPSFAGCLSLLENDLALPYYSPRSFGAAWLEWSQLSLDLKKQTSWLYPFYKKLCASQGYCALGELIEVVKQNINKTDTEISEEIEIQKSKGYLKIVMGLVQWTDFN